MYSKYTLYIVLLHYGVKDKSSLQQSYTLYSASIPNSKGYQASQDRCTNLTLTLSMPLDVGLVIAASTAIISVVGWYRSQVRSNYSHERQATHILNNLEQASLAHQEIFKQLDAVEDRLSRLEILLIKGERV